MFFEHEAHEEHEMGSWAGGIRDLRALRVSNLLRLSLVRRLMVSPRRHHGVGVTLSLSPIPSWPRRAAARTGHPEILKNLMTRALRLPADAERL